jgi:hypothetical protein
MMQFGVFPGPDISGCGDDGCVERVSLTRLLSLLAWSSFPSLAIHDRIPSPRPSVAEVMVVYSTDNLRQVPTCLDQVHRSQRPPDQVTRTSSNGPKGVLLQPPDDRRCESSRVQGAVQGFIPSSIVLLGAASVCITDLVSIMLLIAGP